MKVEIVDRDIFGSIKPDAIIRYLLVNGWSEVRHVEGELGVYQKSNLDGKKQLIWMPISDHFDDYSSMVARLVKIVAEAEAKSELQVVDDFQTVAVGDVIRVRTFDPLDAHEHTVSLLDGITLLKKSRLIALAAASSTLERRPVHPRRPSIQALQFIRNLRLGQTERGSYLIKLIAPINMEQKYEYFEFPNMPERLPFARRAVIELVNGLNSLKDASLENLSRGRFVFHSFLDRVSSGVSANLCEALTSRDDEKEKTEIPIEISVTWSYAITERVEISTRPILFDTNVLPFIRQAAKEFRAKNPEIVTIEGWVNILERDRNAEDGMIRVHTSLDGKPRTVRLKLHGDEYNRAIDAHKKENLITVTGILKVEGNLYQLENPTDFRMIEQLDFLNNDEAVSW